MDAVVISQWALSAGLGAAVGALVVRAVLMRRLALTVAQKADELVKMQREHEQAAVQLKQTQTALDAAMSAASSILTQRNLFDILG